MVYRIEIHHTVMTKAILNPPTPIAATPESAVISKGFSLGIPLRRIKGGWVEYNPNTQQWDVYKVCQR